MLKMEIYASRPKFLSQVPLASKDRAMSCCFPKGTVPSFL